MVRLWIDYIQANRNPDMTIPIYNSEIAPPAKRGMIAGLHAQFVGIGFMVANVSRPSVKLEYFLTMYSGLDLDAHMPRVPSNGDFL